LYRICFLLLPLLLMAVLPAGVSARQLIWKVPVYYVTDRESFGTTYGPKRLKEKGTVSALKAGIVEVCLPKDEDFAPAPWQKTGLSFASAAEMAPPAVKSFKCSSAADLSDEFDAALTETVKKCPAKEAFIFVHGFNNDFEAAATNAAELSFATGCPVILYSWPSAAKLYRYSLDECNNEWSQEHFNQFLEHMNQFKQAQNMKLSLVAHSMGNRLFVRAMPVFSGRRIVSDIYMVNPDFDAQTFVHYISRYLPKEGIAEGVRAQLLLSRKDRALAVSEAIFGGYTRLGQGVDFSLSALTRPDLFKHIWSGPGNAGDEAIGSKDEAERVASISRAIKFVDVTVFDHGLIGHKVPHEYIAWMHYRNTPPAGYELKPDMRLGCNRMSRFFARLGGQRIEPPVGEAYIVSRSQSGPQFLPQAIKNGSSQK
jgi:esterase/lipase superfamily enzyme